MNIKEILGERYKITTNGVVFKVLSAESYPGSKVSTRYKGILDFKPGLLVAIGYRGALIPNITLEGGVGRLTKVEVDGEILNRPHAISVALGIKDDMSSHPLRVLK